MSGNLVLMPVFNDWGSVAKLLGALDNVLAHSGLSADVLLIDDGTGQEPGREFAVDALRGIRSVSVLELKRNLGHQRALCIGLCHVAENADCRRIVVMDADGEDDPADVPRMLEASDRKPGNIVFAERVKRSESLLFRALYQGYRQLYWLLVGHKVRVGNFSVVPKQCLGSLTVAPELWNHYAAAVFALRLPRVMVPTRRGKRIGGQSNMNLVDLVVHGLSAMAVFSDRIGARLLLAVVPVILLVILTILAVIGIRFGTELAVPGWATYSAGLLLVLLFQLTFLALAFCFLILGNRTGGSFLPIRDYGYFVRRLYQVFPPATETAPCVGSECGNAVETADGG